MVSSVRSENHIFVSYAHIDNERFVGMRQGWVDLLHERLEKRLAMLLGKPPIIWRDSKLRGYDVFDQTIEIELSRSAILLSVVTPRYIDSVACRKEVESFITSAARTEAVQLGDKQRVFKAVKTYVPYEHHPPGTRDLLGYQFYERDQASGRVREFDYEIGPRDDKDKRYWEKFEDLAWDLHELIKLIEGDKLSRTLTSPAATIYLAETTSDLSEDRDRVKRELSQHGHTVLPDKALPLKALPLRDAVRDYLKRSRLSVHFIGEHYGIIPEMESERSVVRLQQELAQERGDDHEFSRLIWLPPGLQPKDERQQKFVVDLQNSFTSHNGSELLQVKLEDLKTIIETKLTQKPKQDPLPATTSGIIRVYLICDPQDLEAVTPMQNFLLSQGCEPSLPLWEGSQAEIFDDHKESLLLCDAVLIFQGQASEGWLRMKLRELIKLPGYGRTTPLRGKLIYLGGPESSAKSNFRTLEASVIRNYTEFDPTSLAPFVAQIHEAKGGRP